MTGKSTTITSKRQVTLPADYVRKLQLGRNRILHIELRGRSIVLTPLPTLSTAMRQFWGRHHASRALSDEEIKQAIRNSSVARLARNV